MHRLRAAFSLLLLTSSFVFLRAADPMMVCDDYADPGSVLQVAIIGEGLDNISLDLVDSRERAVSRTEGFTWRSVNGTEYQVALLGIPSSAASGDYTLVLHADQGRARWQQEKRLRLSDQAFPETVIGVDDRMNGIYSDESERKKEESRILWSVLTSFDPTAQYHFAKFSTPLPGGVPTAGFGDRRRYRMPDGGETSSIHYGSDLWAEKGTPVLAAGRGRVVLAVERILTGNTVVIEHLPGVFSSYYHLDSIDVIEGQIVDTGRRIGSVGDTGFATGAHLHWELRISGIPVDAPEFLDRPLLDTKRLISNM